MQIVAGDTVTANGRDWTAVTTPDDVADLFVADPHYTDEERATIARVERVNNARNTSLPDHVSLHRRVLDVSEVTAVTYV